MWGLRHKDTGNISAFFMHIPKTSGTRVLRYISKYYADEYEFKNILDMYNEDRVLHESIGGEPDPRHVHFPIENHAHITLDQAFCLYPNLKHYIADNNIDVFTIVRDPYERFVSCLRFLPTMMQHGIDKGDMIPRYGGSMTPSEFHAIVTTGLFRQQSDWINRNGAVYTRVLHLDEIKGKSNVHVTENLYCDFSKTDGSNEQVAEHIHKSSYVIPKFTLDEETKKFVQWLWKEDFNLSK